MWLELSPQNQKDKNTYTGMVSRMISKDKRMIKWDSSTLKNNNKKNGLF